MSFSGGKDSTVLADLVAKCCELYNCKLTLWYSHTGLEYPEVTQYVNDFVDWLREKYKIEVDLIIDRIRKKILGEVMFRNNKSFSSVTINGQTITCSGSNITISNGKVIVDGNVIQSDIGNNAKVIVNGDVNKIECSGSVEVHGNSGSIDCGGSCTVDGEVKGNIDAGG